jgi:hypothetical protein
LVAALEASVPAEARDWGDALVLAARAHRDAQKHEDAACVADTLILALGTATVEGSLVTSQHLVGLLACTRRLLVDVLCTCPGFCGDRAGALAVALLAVVHGRPGAPRSAFAQVAGCLWLVLLDPALGTAVAPVLRANPEFMQVLVGHLVRRDAEGDSDNDALCALLALGFAGGWNGAAVAISVDLALAVMQCVDAHGAAACALWRAQALACSEAVDGAVFAVLDVDTWGPGMAWSLVSASVQACAGHLGRETTNTVLAAAVQAVRHPPHGRPLTAAFMPLATVLSVLVHRGCDPSGVRTMLHDALQGALVMVCARGLDCPWAAVACVTLMGAWDACTAPVHVDTVLAVTGAAVALSSFPPLESVAVGWLHDQWRALPADAVSLHSHVLMQYVCTRAAAPLTAAVVPAFGALVRFVCGVCDEVDARLVAAAMVAYEAVFAGGAADMRAVLTHMGDVLARLPLGRPEAARGCAVTVVAMVRACLAMHQAEQGSDLGSALRLAGMAVMVDEDTRAAMVALLPQLLRVVDLEPGRDTHVHVQHGLLHLLQCVMMAAAATTAAPHWRDMRQGLSCAVDALVPRKGHVPHPVVIRKACQVILEAWTLPGVQQWLAEADVQSRLAEGVCCALARHGTPSLQALLDVVQAMPDLCLTRGMETVFVYTARAATAATCIQALHAPAGVLEQTSQKAADCRPSTLRHRGASSSSQASRAYS